MSTTTPTDLLSVRRRIVGIDQKVPVLDGSLRPYINFDNAASTPTLQDVLDTVNDFMNWYSSVHRGTGFKSKVATQAYDDARRIVAEPDRLDEVLVQLALAHVGHGRDAQAFLEELATVDRPQRAADVGQVRDRAREADELILVEDWRYHRDVGQVAGDIGCARDRH